MCSNEGMGKQINWDEGRRLYTQGKSPREISLALGCNKSSVCRRINKDNWVKAETVIKSIASGSVVSREGDGGMIRGRKVSGEDVKGRLQSDVEASLSALESINPADLGLNQLGSREKVAGDLTKRASQLFDMIEKEQPTMNIAVLAQLPD
jgi:hypothetical protein